MDRLNEEPQPLSFGAVSLLELVAQSFQPELSAPLAPPTEEQMVRYLCQALSREAMCAVDCGMAEHSSSLMRLAQIRGDLDALQRMPWNEVAERATAEGDEARIARLWLVLVQERLHAASHARQRWTAQGWSDVRKQAAEGIAEAQSAWAAFVSFGRQLKTQMTVQGRQFAAARGAEETGLRIQGELPPGVRLEILEGEVTATGQLHVAIAVRDSSGASSAALDGKRVSLSLVTESDLWLIASGVVEEASLLWNLPSLGAALNLPKGQIPASYLQIALEQGEATSQGPALILAEVLDTTGKPTRFSPAPIELHSEPYLQDEQFSIEIAMPAATQAAYGDYRLLLDVLISLDNWQRLGAWPVRDWTEAPRLLTVSFPASADAVALPASFLRAKFQP